MLSRVKDILYIAFEKTQKQSLFPNSVYFAGEYFSFFFLPPSLSLCLSVLASIGAILFII